MSNHPVKWFNSNFDGAPQVTDTYDSINGNYVAMLKACLVTGFGDKAITSLTWDDTANQAVANFQNGHGFQVDSIIEIYDASDAAYNGEHRVLNVTANEVRVALDSTPAGEASGASMKVAPAGWSVYAESADGKVVVFDTGSDYGNVMVRVANNDTEEYKGYKLFGTSSTQCVYAKVSLVTNVIDVDTYELECEGVWEATHTGGSSSSQRAVWNIVADDGMFYLFFSYGYYGYFSAHYAGYINSLKTNDLYHCVMNTEVGWSPNIASSNQDFDYSIMSYNLNAFHHNGVEESYHTNYRYLARSFTQVKGAQSCCTRGVYRCSGYGMQEGNPVDGGQYANQGEIPVYEYHFYTDDKKYLRGFLPGTVEPYYSSYSETGGSNVRHLEARANEVERIVRFCCYFGPVDNGSTKSGSVRSPGVYTYEKSIAFDIGDKGWRA